MEALRAWQDAAAFIVSCPGPARRHARALTKLADLVLPQVLLGSESQLLAFAAAAPELAGRFFFTPTPEIFPGAASVRAALGLPGDAPVVHIRFGGVRAARVIKGVRNGAVLAEAMRPPPITASAHPFASGLVVPALMRRVFIYHGGAVRPTAAGGTEILPAAKLTEDFITADLATAETSGNRGGIDLVSLAQFRAASWAAGTVRPKPAATRGAAPALLLPWNLDHPGSIVPDMLERLARLAGTPRRVIILPFNYIGLTGTIRRLIARLRAAAHDPEAVLAQFSVARITARAAVAHLRGLGPAAWVDGNDPEAWWVVARLAACGISTVLIDPEEHAAMVTPPALRVPATERVLMASGQAHIPAWLPAWREMPHLLAMSGLEAQVARRKPAGQRTAIA